MSNCAVADNGTLKDGNDIQWFNDADDVIPIPASRPLMASSSVICNIPWWLLRLSSTCMHFVCGLRFEPENYLDWTCWTGPLRSGPRFEDSSEPNHRSSPGFKQNALWTGLNRTMASLAVYVIRWEVGTLLDARVIKLESRITESPLTI